MFSSFFFCRLHHRALHSFPTRRSSDLSSKRCSSPCRGPGCREATVTMTARNRSERPRAGYPGEHRTTHVRSEEHTSELQSLRHLVCRLLLEKKKKKRKAPKSYILRTSH